jgi:LmbE family N-acetylglucosaminyl deacetylase
MDDMPVLPLLGSTLALVAHPDDEVIACGALLQRMQRAVVVFATDGAPRNEGFWKQYGSRQAYADVRRQEARRALRRTGAGAMFLADFVPGGIADQELFRTLPAAITALERVIAEERPECILTLAYEGGHPDHDAACFMASVTGGRANLPVWESPLYHRNADGASVLQAFPRLTGTEVELRSECSQLENKIAMFHTYQSQGLLLESFRPDYETYRPLADYDFTRPPLPWKLNYEYWRWPMTGEEVSAAFAEYLRREGGKQAS